MIELQNIRKTFLLDSGQEVVAIDQVSLKINQGEIYGIIGHSGAGKSTLVRCINYLERPSSGKVLIEGEDLSQFDDHTLRTKRHRIGMIFQQFNLLSARTVYENVAFLLKYQGIPKEVIRQKVENLLDLVGLGDRLDAYPSQLSGGQKQRVAIARALANDPQILLCDEATSALDPQTTQSILDLLKKLNQDLGLTIVLITHEMNVVKSICHRVAVMEAGKVVEEGPVVDVFVNPKRRITKEFVDTVSNFSKIEGLLEAKSAILKLEDQQSLVRLNFHGGGTRDAIISDISRRFELQASIIFANVDIVQDTIIGSLVIILSGEKSRKEAALKYLKEREIYVEVIQDAGDN